jgi:dolichyl-diphosphooligosaccharide--protein glycosyltransferase/undecaprenyl-diphosphooligosaccharide--protein glycosyltransferase
MTITTKNKQTILFILIAFIFSFSMRLIWLYQFNDAEYFKFNDQFMINTNDGYFWAEGARDILGKTPNINLNSPINTAPAQLTAFLVKILPFSFETVIFYMSAFFSSLLVVPIILIARSLGKLEVGFIAALISSIAWSYYNRTMIGYYDTDFLNIVFPTLLLWSLIWAIRTQENKYLIITSIDIIAYRWWYPQSYSLEFAFFGLVFSYVIYQYIKKENCKYNVILLTFMMFAMMGLDGYLRLSIVVLLFIFLQYETKKFHQYLYYLFGISLVLFLLTGGFDPIWGQLKGYVFKDHISVVGTDLKLHYFTVMQTIREAGQIPFETFANRISGHSITFIISLIGYIWLVFRFPIMLLGLPMIGLGFLAYSGGLRFTIYAVPMMGLGLGFLIVEVCSYLKNNILRFAAIGILIILALIPNIQHIIEYKVPTVFYKNEVAVLDKLKNIANRNDYVVSWWDYGYPIRYYSDTKTLSDGGKHSGAVNFPTSFAFTKSQKEAANMLRLDVEYTEMLAKSDFDDPDRNRTNIANMTLDYGFENTNYFLNTLKEDIKLPLKTRDIYFYLPSRMMSIYPTINLFSNLNLMDGIKSKQPFFYTTKKFQEDTKIIDLDNNIKLIKKTGQLDIQNQLITINNFAKTSYDKKGKLQVQVKKINPNSNINVIFISSLKEFLIIDNATFNSTYIQLFVFENYDKNLFEPVIFDQYAKVYKLKI